MATVVGVGFEPGPFFPPHGSPRFVSHHLDRDDLEELTVLLAELIEQHGAVVAIYPAWSSDVAMQRLQTVRCALHTTKLAFYPTPSPPLAGAVLTSLANVVAPHARSAGALLAGLPVLEAHLLVLAWLGSVAKLQVPTPTLVQHGLSLLPWTVFGVSSWPQPAVRRLTRKDRSLPLPKVRGPIRIAFAARNAEESWVPEVVAPALGGPPVVQVPATVLGPQWWGAKRLIEVVAYPIELQTAVERVNSAATYLCGWCLEETPPGPCAFCGWGLPLGTSETLAEATA